jgi:hypothetical protein
MKNSIRRTVLAYVLSAAAQAMAIFPTDAAAVLNLRCIYPGQAEGSEVFWIWINEDSNSITIALANAGAQPSYAGLDTMPVQICADKI